MRFHFPLFKNLPLLRIFNSYCVVNFLVFIALFYLATRCDLVISEKHHVPWLWFVSPCYSSISVLTLFLPVFSASRYSELLTEEEVTRITRDKLIKLQSLYIEQFKWLQYVLKEQRRKYLHDRAAATENADVSDNHCEEEGKLVSDFKNKYLITWIGLTYISCDLWINWCSSDYIKTDGSTGSTFVIQLLMQLARQTFLLTVTVTVEGWQ